MGGILLGCAGEVVEFVLAIGELGCERILTRREEGVRGRSPCSARSLGIRHEVIVTLIANTPTQQGLTIKAALETGRYPTGIKLTAQAFAKVKLKKAKFHGEWNDTMMPTKSAK